MQEKRQRSHIVPAGVCIERDEQYFVVYRGSREALIAAGLAKPKHFPPGKKRLSWHYPAVGENWSIRHRYGNVYCLTKLKDRRGIVDNEVGAFKLAAAARARGDTAFQRFLLRLRSGLTRREGARGAPISGTRFVPGWDARRGAASAAPHSRISQGRGQADSLGWLAIGTLLAGVTLYLWSRKP